MTVINLNFPTQKCPKRPDWLRFYELNSKWTRTRTSSFEYFRLLSLLLNLDNPFRQKCHQAWLFQTFKLIFFRNDWFLPLKSPLTESNWMRNLRNWKWWMLSVIEIKYVGTNQKVAKSANGQNTSRYSNSSFSKTATFEELFDFFGLVDDFWNKKPCFSLEYEIR